MGFWFGAARCVFFVGLAALAAACDAASASPTSEPSTRWNGPPWFTLDAPDGYPLVDGRAQPLLVRNISGRSPGEVSALLDLAHAAGTRLVRIHLTQGLGSSLGIDRNGKLDQVWAGNWESVFDAAASRGISVVPVFGIWGDWNSGSPALGWANWNMNPLASSRGGPASAPSDLLQDTPTRKLWLDWLDTLVQRWAPRANIAAWEIFSEIDIMTGSDEASATAFAELAADVIRSEDAAARPVMASTSDLSDWTTLWASRANDIVQLHPYDTELDQDILTRVQTRRQSGKPVFIGESGLSPAAPDGTTATSAPNAEIGLRHAIWAGLVSGAIDARAFWWEDSYAIYYGGTGRSLVDRYATLESTVPNFVGALDFKGLSPAIAMTSNDLFGAALARTDLALAWFRDAECVYPDWSCSRTLSGMEVRIELPAGASDAAWSVTVFDPITGEQNQLAASVQGGALVLTLPAFQDSIAFYAEP